jgi:hypothetical protein
MKAIVKDKFTFIRNDGNRKLIVSSHGGYLGSTFTTPVALKFLAHQNYCAKGQVTRVAAMADNEFETERAGTSNITDYELTNYQYDDYSKLVEVVNDNQFDVVTIQKNQKVKLTEVLASPEINLFGYSEVYCMFCRVPMQRQRVKVM